MKNIKAITAMISVFSLFFVNAVATERGDESMHIIINGTISYKLNNSPAARDLYAQLPLRVKVENFSSNEKIFYPKEKLETTNTPLAPKTEGALAYYAPWGNVVMFYDAFEPGSGLYSLGEVISGKESIASLSGTIEITK